MLSIQFSLIIVASPWQPNLKLDRPSKGVDWIYTLLIIINIERIGFKVVFFDLKERIVRSAYPLWNDKDYILSLKNEQKSLITKRIGEGNLIPFIFYSILSKTVFPKFRKKV